MHKTSIFTAALLLSLAACKKDEPQPNQLPQTYTSVEAINLTGDDRLNSEVTLKWWGTDPDGYVVGYEYSFDQTSWAFTERQDSTFQFSIGAGEDTTNISLWIRAIDDQAAFDDTPAFLSIPLKNTAPEVAFDADLLPEDSVRIVTSLSWNARDNDGDETIETIELKINDGAWRSIPVNRSFVSVLPESSQSVGAVSSTLYFDQTTAETGVDGLRLDDWNTFYIKATDQSGAESTIDTSSQIYIKKQNSDLLLIGANVSSPNAFYSSSISAVYPSGFDFWDMIKNNGVNQPKTWNPTFGLLIGFYDKLVIYADDASFTNAQTNDEGLLVEFAASAIQAYVDAGGKAMVSMAFPDDFDPNSSLFGIFPMDSLSSAPGLARLPIDSMAIGALGYPDLTSSEFITSLDPIYLSGDAEAIYTAQLTKSGGWEGPNTIGARRQNAGNTSLVFITAELHRLDQNITAIEALFDKVLNDEFDW